MLDVQLEFYTHDLYINRYLHEPEVIRDKINARVVCWVNGRKAWPFLQFSSRLAWYTRNYFIKLDDHRNGGQSQREWENWQEYKDSRAAKYLVPVLGHGIADGLHWVAQPKVCFLPDEHVSRDMERRAWRKIERVVNKLYLADVGQLHREGWAIEASTLEPVIYDYGY